MRIQPRALSSITAFVAEHRRFANAADHWVFRGQADARWPLTTSLDRAAELLRLVRLKRRRILRRRRSGTKNEGAACAVNSLKRLMRLSPRRARATEPPIVRSAK